jgi:dynein heavy chain
MEEEIVKHEHGLQKMPRFMNKIIQLFDIFNIRFGAGATLVGPGPTGAGKGKSTCYRTLAAIMSNLRNKGSKSELYQVGGRGAESERASERQTEGGREELIEHVEDAWC